MRAGPTICGFSFSKVHKRKLENLEPQTKVLHDNALFISIWTSMNFRLTIIIPYCQGKREAIARTETNNSLTLSNEEKIFSHTSQSTIRYGVRKAHLVLFEGSRTLHSVLAVPESFSLIFP